MTLEKFDLEKALAGWPVVTRQEMPIRKVVGFFPEIADTQKLVVIDHEGDLLTYSAEGIFSADSIDGCLDLFMAVTA